MSSALIGYSGLVGSNLLAQHSFNDLYNSSNIHTIDGKSFDLVICAGAGGWKWWANNNPREDYRRIRHLLAHLHTVAAQRFVLISTIDVYPDSAGQHDERYYPPRPPDHHYGRHRWELEQEAAQIFADCLIVRLPGIYGINLKKNTLFDLLHCHYLEGIHPESTYQWYWLGRLWNDLQCVIRSGLECINLFTEPLAVSELVAAVFPDLYSFREQHLVINSEQRQVKRSSAAALINYDLQTAHAHLFTHQGGIRYIQNKSEVIADIRAYCAKFALGFKNSL